MSREAERRFWRLAAIWSAIMMASCAVHTYVAVIDAARHGRSIPLWQMLLYEGSSHLVLLVLVPALYWLDWRWPVVGAPRNLVVRLAAVVPFSAAHIAGMVALRLLVFAMVTGPHAPYAFRAAEIPYEFAKDVFSYATLSVGILALSYLLARREPVAAVVPPPSVATGVPERFTVRKRGKEIVVELSEIDWIEAAGNYAVLHVGGETYEIRSSLTKLEAELDARRFVRVHKSYVVNIGRVADVTPWISGDWRIRMQDGAEVNLSRRYRQRFESLAPVKS
jgi:DNA-binding LytR/AlgR family response regulator